MFIETFLQYVKNYITKNEKKYDEIIAQALRWESIIDEQIEENILRMEKEILIETKRGHACLDTEFLFAIWTDGISSFVFSETVMNKIKSRIPTMFDKKFEVIDFSRTSFVSELYNDKFLHMKKYVYRYFIRIKWRFEKI